MLVFDVRYCLVLAGLPRVATVLLPFRGQRGVVAAVEPCVSYSINSGIVKVVCTSTYNYVNLYVYLYFTPSKVFL